jgi:hypothetical protein
VALHGFQAEKAHALRLCGVQQGRNFAKRVVAC